MDSGCYVTGHGDIYTWIEFEIIYPQYIFKAALTDTKLLLVTFNLTLQLTKNVYKYYPIMEHGISMYIQISLIKLN